MILYFLSVVVILIAPAIIGIFWGAPLIARELEAGTFRLAWNQSVTRTRWLAVKLALIGVAAMAVTEAFSLIQAWWAAPIGKAVGLGGSGSIFSETRFGVFVFPTHGITPLGYAAFGFALGVTAGLLVRRAIPAMAITLAIFAAAQLITPLGSARTCSRPARRSPRSRPRERTSVSRPTPGWRSPPPSSPASPEPGSSPAKASTPPGSRSAPFPRPASRRYRGHSAGSRYQPGLGLAHCSPRLNNCVASHGIRVAENYQPASHYWPLQWSETGMFLALALALAGYCFWRLNRRRRLAR